MIVAMHSKQYAYLRDVGYKVVRTFRDGRVFMVPAKLAARTFGL